MIQGYKPEKPQTHADPAVGSNICMCPSCGEYFGGIRGFEMHRAGEFPDSRHCVDPASVGLIIKKGKCGTWWIQGFGKQTASSSFKEAA